MPKKSNRETVTMGHPLPRRKALVDMLENTPAGAIRTTGPTHPRVEPSEVALALGAEPAPRPELYAGADPADVVGLDGFLPSGDTPRNGDPERTVPDPSRPRAGKRPPGR